jgi:AcrR family transcriptional regulator
MARPRSEEARRKVLVAASDLMAEKGVSSLSIDQVASMSGVAKTTIYRHWPERTSLIVDAVNAQIEHVGTPDTGTLRGDLETWWGGLLRSHLSGNAGNIIPSLVSASVRDPEMAYLLDRIGADRERVMKVIIERAIERGELSTDYDVETLVGIIAGPIVFQKMVRRRPVTPDYIAACLDVLLTGLGAETRETREER